MFKMFLTLYADDTVIFANSCIELQNSLDALYEYCCKWKLVVSSDKLKPLFSAKVAVYKVTFRLVILVILLKL
jgi:hypothetical protein